MIKKILEIYDMWNIFKNNDNSNIHENLSSRHFLWKSCKNWTFLSMISSAVSMLKYKKRSVTIRREICPIRNFNTQTWGKIVYFLFVWLVGIGFRQNFFRVLPNFGDFGAKMSFFHYIINQNRNNFIKHCSPPVYQEAADIRDVYLYKKFAVQVGSWYTGGGTMFYRQKTKGVSA